MNQPARDETGGSEEHTHDSIEILGVRLLMLTSATACQELLKACGSRRCAKVYIPNAATLNLACGDPSYRKLLNAGDFVLRDGIGLQIAAWLQGARFPANLVGTDLTPALCKELGQRGMSFYLLGGRPGITEKAAQKLVTLSPGLKLAGCRNGYFTDDEAKSVVADINEASPDLLLIAFGNPLQEQWIDRHARELQVGAAVGVGGLVDHLAGELKRAPMWMRRCGLEWLHILLGQPHKWRRYLLGNPLFLMRIAAERISSRFKKAMGHFRNALKRAVRWTLCLATSAPPSAKPDVNAVRILTYHDIQDISSGDDPFCVRVSAFRRQMEVLAKNWNVIGLGEALDALHQQKPLPPKTVAITFDDGHRGVLEHAAPVLRELGLPATLFLRCDVLDAGRDPAEKGVENNYITWDEARDLQAAGWEIGSHTLTHRPLSMLSREEARREIHESKQLLEHRLHTEVRFFSYPYGTGSECSDDLALCVEDAGYSGAVTSFNDINTLDTDPYTLRRTKVERHDSLRTFERLLRGGMDCWKMVDMYGSILQERDRTRRPAC